MSCRRQIRPRRKIASAGRGSYATWVTGIAPHCSGIAVGIGFFIAYPIIKLLIGRWREIRLPMALLGAVLLVYFLMLRS
ncbi:MAG: hypothetical protein HYV35_05195 [Lentisphaerae bacterium]|nr:hypothetical protein [Lentisphaerota bacterium]